LWGEEIEINKKMVKSTRKYKGMEKRKLGVDVKTEKTTIRYPDNRKEEIT
jgi:hypothetical protein